MTVENFRGENDNYDKFPIGLRVLAVDDDPTCLKLLETLLKKCQYNVTTTNQARSALNMLREDKDRFDLVISDVHMPDMDGFKLLEHVGLEMDLPVIMLSANGDPKLVMKGVTHGACDYLVKPVRLEELKNIWQHVIRKKKVDPKKQSKSANQVQARQGNGEVQEPATKGNTNAEQNGRVNRKRKDDEDESEDDGNDSDPTTQKKPRVVWSIELHRKFVAAVNQLGIEKAVPKRILDMMNVEGLTRENVASHLQKYRLYLKRISTVANHQVNMAAALGFKDTFMRGGSYDGFGDFRTLGGTGRIGNPTLSPYNTATTGMLGRLNSPSNVNLRNVSPLIQTSPTHNSNNSFNTLGKVHPIVSGQNSNLFQGIPSSLELDQLQSKGGMGITGFDDSRMFTSGNLVGGPATGSSSNLLNNVPNNPMTLSQLGNMSSQNMAFNSEPFNVRPTGSSNLLDPGLLESYKGHSNPLVSTRSFGGQLPLNDARDNSSSNAHFMPNLASLPLDDSRGMMSHEGLIGEVNQRWGDNGQTYGQGINNNVFGSLTSHSPGSGILSPNQGSVQSNGFYNQTMPHMTVNGRSTCGASTLIQQNDSAAKLVTEPRARSNENFVLEQPELQGGFVPQGYDLDALMNSVIKREQNGGLPGGLSNCNFGFEDYEYGSGL